MADVTNKTTLVTLYRKNTPDYPTASWLINAAGVPALDAAPYVPIKYRKLITGDTDVGEMTQGEKDAYDAANPPPDPAPTLIPVLTTTQRDNVGSPASGMLICNSTTKAIEQYNGTAWETVGLISIGTLSVQDPADPAKKINLSHNGSNALFTWSAGELRLNAKVAFTSAAIQPVVTGAMNLGTGGKPFGEIHGDLMLDIDLSADVVGLNIEGYSSQTKDLIAVKDNAAAILSRFNKAGYFMTRKVAAPADGDIATSEMAIWFDDANVAPKLMIKAKDDLGTVVTGSIALT